MKQNSKLSLALHALGHMARAPGQPMTSDLIAQHNATNPVVVRRVLGVLREQGIVRSDKGHAGGWQLAKPANQITVADVYAAIAEPFLSPVELGPTATCAIQRAMFETVQAAQTEAEAVILRHFRERSLQDLADAMQGQIPPLHPSKTPL
jgi:Rrf2 family protein